MSTCWSCQASTSEAVCAACGAPQPLPAGADHFSVLDLPRTYFLEPAQIEQAFKALNRKLHPDRHAQKGARERRLALEWTTAINDAWRTLKDPIRRGGYLLKLQGLDVEKEGGGAARQLAPEFLEEVMEVREALAEAKADADPAKVGALAGRVRAQAAAATEELAQALRAWENGRDATSLERAADRLVALKYFRRFEEEVEAFELAALET